MSLPLIALNVQSIGAKKRARPPDGNAAQLRATLSLLEPGADREWMHELSDRQFDMLLSIRLYTGALYRFMVLTPPLKDTCSRMGTASQRF